MPKRQKTKVGLTGRKENMEMSTTGPNIRKGRGSSMKELPADDPIYTRGYAIGVMRSTSPKPTVHIPSMDECAPAAGDFPDYPAPSCPDCGGFVVLMERLGDTVHYRCRNCGIGFSREEPASRP